MACVKRTFFGNMRSFFRNRQSVVVIFYSLLIISLLAGCNQGQRMKYGFSKSKRLVVTNSDALEMLLGLGAAENIVGIDDEDMSMKTFGAKYQWKSIGTWQNPNIEAIINLAPDIVIAYPRTPAPVGFDDKLIHFNISVERINGYHMSEYHSDIYRLASFVDKKNMADTLINDFDRIINMIENAVADIEVKKKIYVEYSDFVAAGAGSGNNEMIEMINATNIAAHLGPQYPKISTEWLLEENPDVIIKIITSGEITAALYEQMIARPGWDRLDAVKNGDVYLMSPELCSGPRAMIGCLYFGKWCYPEKFASINPDSIHTYWLDKYYGISTDNNVYTLKMEI